MPFNPNPLYCNKNSMRTVAVSSYITGLINMPWLEQPGMSSTITNSTIKTSNRKFKIKNLNATKCLTFLQKKFA